MIRSLGFGPFRRSRSRFWFPGGRDLADFEIFELLGRLVTYSSYQVKTTTWINLYRYLGIYAKKDSSDWTEVWSGARPSTAPIYGSQGKGGACQVESPNCLQRRTFQWRPRAGRPNPQKAAKSPAFEAVEPKFCVSNLQLACTHAPWHGARSRTQRTHSTAHSALGPLTRYPLLAF